MPKFIVESLADNLITLSVPGSNYRNAFLLKSATPLQPGERLSGLIHAPAWKLDRVELGGNYVEPLYGRPRRMQGTILSVNPAANQLTVKVGYEVTVTLPEKYNAADYQPGQRVGWDNIEIPTFTPAPIPVPASLIPCYSLRTPAPCAKIPLTTTEKLNVTEPTRPSFISPDTRRSHRIPPGQAETKKWPVLHYGNVPRVKLENWDFTITGLVESDIKLNWQQFRALPWIDVHCDIHCVTRWSRLNNIFSGPSTRTILSLATPKPSAKFVLIHCEQGFTTNLSLEEFLHDDCLFAIEHDAQPLSPDHGYPARLVVPKLYFWKSAKWIRGIELMTEDVPGFWEQNGYHMHGDPWTEERHSWE